MHLQLLSLMVWGLFLLLPALTAAQVSNSCEALHQNAVTQLVEYCSPLSDTNFVCYGHPDVQVTLTANSTESSFSKPGDKIKPEAITAIQTSAPDPTTGQWGISLIQFPSVTMLMMGDATLTREQNTPLFSFLLRTGMEPTCSITPSLVAVQATQELPIELRINNANLKISGFVILRWQSAQVFAVFVPSGRLEVSSGEVANSGETLLALMDNGIILGWGGGTRAISPKEMEIVSVVSDTFRRLGILSRSESETTSASSSSASCQNNPVHTVQRGENLFRISRRYGVTINDLAAANGIANTNQIAVGQQLVIPCGVDSGISSVAPITEGNTQSTTSNPSLAPSETVPASIDCNLTIPLSDLPQALQDVIRQVCP